MIEPSLPTYLPTYLTLSVLVSFLEHQSKARDVL